MSIGDDLSSIGHALTKHKKAGYKLPDWKKPGATAVGKSVTNLLDDEFTPYTGQFTAPTSAQQNWSMNQLQGLLGDNMNPDDLIDRSGKYFNPFIDARFSAIDEATARGQMSNDASRHMAGAFGDTGAGVARGEIESGRQSAYDQAMMEAYDKALGYAGTDIANEMSANNSTLTGLNSLFGQGAQTQETEQAQLNALYKEFLRPDLEMQQKADLASQILARLPEGDKKKGTASILSQIISGVGSVVSAGMAPTPS